MAFQDSLNEFNRGALGQSLGAFFQGTSRANVQQQQMQLDDQRKGAMAKDAFQALTLLDAGDFNSVNALLTQRTEMIGQLGGDPSDTAELQQRLQAGDIAGVRDALSTVVKGAQAVGYLPKPKQVSDLDVAEAAEIRAKTAKMDREATPEYLSQVRADKEAERDQKKLERERKRVEFDFKREEFEEKKLDSQIQREANSLKREELEAVKLQKKRDIKFQAQNEIDNFDNTIGTIDRLLEGEGLEKSAGWQAMTPTMAGTDAANFEAMLETLQSQAFLSQITKMKGMGALSENEGKKLSAAIGSLSLSMSDTKLRSELSRIRGVFDKAKSATVNKYQTQEPIRVNF